MDAKEYVQAALRTEYTPDFITTTHGAAHDRMLARIMHALLGKMSELGELAGAVKAHLIYSRPLDVVNLVEELGDDAWYTALLVDALSIGFEAAWEKNIAKLRARYPERFTFEAANNRNERAERAALEGIEANPKG